MTRERPPAYIEPDNPGARHLVRVIVAILLLIGFGLMAGCAATPRPQPVYVPVPVECREEIPDRPLMPTQALTRGHALDEKVRAALAEIELREGYEIRLVAALEACTRPIEPDGH